MKKFDIPVKYKSSLIAGIKAARKAEDPRKKDFSPTELDFGPVKFFVARHFGFCYGVENAVEIAYKALKEHPDKRIYLLSEMIHNPLVNEDLRSHGIDFIMDTEGKLHHSWDEITPDDVVVIPAFGTTREMMEMLNDTDAHKYTYNTTCPFVEKVWKRAESLGKEDYTIIIHGKYNHEETRATFSHSASGSPSVIVRDMEEAKLLAGVITGEKDKNFFYEFFAGKYSEGFDPETDLNKVGVVNQTTMLASETEEIAALFRNTMISKYGMENIADHFADTRDTLCYATNDNQQATYGLMETDADIAVVVGGYNSSNTTHIVEILEEKFPVYFIESDSNITSTGEIKHFDIHSKNEKTSRLPEKKGKLKIAVTCGASCPDSMIEAVINKLVTLFDETKDIETVLSGLAAD